MNAATRLADGGFLDHAWSSSQLVGSLVAALVAELGIADHGGGLVRFVLGGHVTGAMLATARREKAGGLVLPSAPSARLLASCCP